MNKIRLDKKDKALALFQKGRYVESRNLYMNAARKRPGEPEIHYMLGVVHGHLGEYSAAISCFRQAIGLYPASAMAHFGLGMAFRAMGDLKDAEENYQRTLLLRPNFADAELELANTYAQLGEKLKAIELYRKTSRDNPGYYKTRLAQGAMLEIDGKFKEAIAVYRQSLEAAPSVPEIHLKLASCLYAIGRLDQAEEEITAARKLNTRSPEILYEQAKIKISLGKLDDALDCYQAIGAVCGNSISLRAGALVGEAGIEEQKGNDERAIELIQPLISEGVENPALGALYLKYCSRLNACAEAELYCSNLLDKETISVKERMGLEYHLGKYFDKKNDFERAFLHFRNANDLGETSYDSIQETGVTDLIISGFSPAFFMAAPRATTKTEKPVFIVGMPRSGTSLIEQIIDSHPLTYGAGELNKIAELVNSEAEKRNTGKSFPSCLDQDTLNKLSDDYIKYIENLNRKAIRICDKMPHNFAHLGMISLMFPNARVIHCKRNPADTCLSIYTQNFNESHAYARDLYRLGQHYRNYERLMMHWKSLLDIKIHEVQYEDVVGNLEEEARALIKFCGLEWDDRCLEFHKSRRVVATSSYDQVNKPIYSSSINRWKKYDTYLGPLFEGLEGR